MKCNENVDSDSLIYGQRIVSTENLSISYSYLCHVDIPTPPSFPFLILTEG